METLKFKVARLEAAMEESKAQEGHALQVRERTTRGDWLAGLGFGGFARG